ncbi:hypothetical protein K8R47_01615 [archaeon]|nr:hypothetical protein [archaeon]
MVSSSFPWIIISIGALIILFAIVFLILVKKRKKPIPTDYYNFFIIGLIWFPFGVIFDNIAFSVMGLVFMIIGLVNKDKWKKNRRMWKDLDKTERNIKMWLIIFLGILVLLGLVMLFLVNKGIL